MIEDDPRHERELTKARKSRQKYLQEVSAAFQEMVKAEAGAAIDPVPRIDGSQKIPALGFVVCVTCQRVRQWSSKEMQAGHFIGSRGQSILFEERNCHPQCCWCNMGGGKAKEYSQWMTVAYGSECVEELEVLKRQPKSWTIFELVEMRLEYMDRLTAAKKSMGET